MPDVLTKTFPQTEMISELSFRNVTYHYPKATRASLQSINLTVNKNRMIAVMGRTAAGKTTLLSTINGLIPHFSEGKFEGQILVQGNDTQDLSVQKLVPYVGFVMQDAETQILGLTVEKDVAFGPCNLAFPRHQIEKNVDAAIHTVQLDPYRYTSPDRLSGGEKQRLAICRRFWLWIHLYWYSMSRPRNWIRRSRIHLSHLAATKANRQTHDSIQHP